jgi:hypothetical protein
LIIKTVAIYLQKKIIIMRTYYASSENGYYRFVAKNISEAKHWVINHLDSSKEWIVGEIINPTDINPD